jgi:hypothetical protein
MPAPVASGWSGCRVGLHPLEKRRLVTAHVVSGRCFFSSVGRCVHVRGQDTAGDDLTSLIGADHDRFQMERNFYAALGFSLLLDRGAAPVGFLVVLHQDDGVEVGRVTIEQVVREIWPFYGVMFFVLMLVTYIPSVSLWLPRILGL